MDDSPTVTSNIVTSKERFFREPSLYSYFTYHGQKVDVHRCVDCQSNFSLDTQTINWFLNKNLALPKRCEPCRDIRRINDVR